jgi:hypothetical protein
MYAAWRVRFRRRVFSALRLALYGSTGIGGGAMPEQEGTGAQQQTLMKPGTMQALAVFT